MISRAVLGLALGAAACGSGVHDASIASTPLVTLHGHVDTAALTRAHPDVPLIAALVWAGVPAVNPVCLQFDRPELQGVCPDPFGVFTGELERGAPVAPDGTFALELYHLPLARVSVGDEATRIAYGSLIILEDVNGDGQPSFIGRGMSREGDRRGDVAPLTTNADTMVAATFTTLRAAQTRVVFREGGFVKDSGFYPMPGCEAPPRGFSIVEAPPWSEAPTAGGGCAARDITSTVEVLPLPRAEADAFACRSVQRGSRVREPQEDEKPPRNSQNVCLSHEILAEVVPGVCRRLRVLALKGCNVDPLCKTPEWDQANTPPSWWPCP